MGLFGGLLPMVGFLMVQMLNIEVASEDTYQCQYVPTLYEYSMQETPLNSSSCVKSQLTDLSRSQLMLTFEKTRNNLSHNYSNVFQMNYHWILEFVAAKLIFEIFEKDSSPMTVIPNDTVSEILNDFQKRAKPDPAEPNYEIDVGSLSFSDVLEYTLTVYDMPIPSGTTQQEIVYSLLTNFSAGTYLELGGVKRLFPGTTIFGCSIRYDDDEENLNRLTCVFATHQTADREYKQGILNAESCNASKPAGYFDTVRNLCIDKKFVNSSHTGKDVPCQFFYGVSSNQTLKPSCNRIDASTDSTWSEPPMCCTAVEISYNGGFFLVEYPEDVTKTPKGSDGTKLHSIPICFIALIALISSIFSRKHI